MLVMLTELLSGLALFLFGMKFMSEGLQKAAGDKMRVILDRVTKNRFIAVIFGAIFTAIIQSSGATTVMEVSFVNAGLLTLEQSRWYYIWCQHWYNNYCTACFFETDCHCTVYHLCRCMPDDVWQ